MRRQKLKKCSSLFLTVPPAGRQEQGLHLPASPKGSEGEREENIRQHVWQVCRDRQEEGGHGEDAKRPARYHAEHRRVGVSVRVGVSFSLKLTRNFQGGRWRAGHRPQQYHGGRRHQNESGSERGNWRRCKAVRGGNKLNCYFYLCICSLSQ